MQPKTPLFTSDSQHPPRFRHAVYLGVDESRGFPKRSLVRSGKLDNKRSEPGILFISLQVGLLFKQAIMT